MPRFTSEQVLELKAKIRSILIRKPRASKYELAKILSISKDIALKLRNKVHQENAERIDKEVLNEEVAKVEVAFEEIELECWRILSKGKRGNDGKVIELYPTNKEMILALKTLLDAKNRLFEIKFDAGIFKRQLGEGEINLTEVFKKIIKSEEKTKQGKNVDTESIE